MRDHCDQRLTVIGPKREIRRFRNSSWAKIMRARHLDPLELSPGRFGCQFETDTPALARWQRLSRRWPGLVFLVEFEVPGQRIKGLAKAGAGQLEHCAIGY